MNQSSSDIARLHNDFMVLLNKLRTDEKSRVLASDRRSSGPEPLPPVSEAHCRVCVMKEKDGKRWSECQEGCSPKMLDLMNQDVQKELDAIYPQDMEILRKHGSLMQALTASDPLREFSKDKDPMRLRQVMSMPVSVRVLPAEMYRQLFESLRNDAEFRELLARRLPMFKNEDRFIVDQYLNN